MRGAVLHLLAAVRTPPPAMQQADAGGVVLLTGSGLSLTHDGDTYCFQDIDLTLSRGAKVALVGVNGAGKSSLLRVLAAHPRGQTAG